MSEVLEITEPTPKKGLITRYPRNEVNPFDKQLEKQELRQKFINKKRVKDDKDIIYVTNTDSGEEVTVRFEKKVFVDDEKFIKIFVSKIGIFQELSKTGIRVLEYILKKLKPNQDKVYIDIEECKAMIGFKQSKSIYQGLANLIEKEVIARGYNEITYFTNPTIIYNGNRVKRIEEVKSYTLK